MQQLSSLQAAFPFAPPLLRGVPVSPTAQPSQLLAGHTSYMYPPTSSYMHIPVTSPAPSQSRSSIPFINPTFPPIYTSPTFPHQAFTTSPQNTPLPNTSLQNQHQPRSSPAVSLPKLQTTTFPQSQPHLGPAFDQAYTQPFPQNTALSNTAALSAHASHHRIVTSPPAVHHSLPLAAAPMAYPPLITAPLPAAQQSSPLGSPLAVAAVRPHVTTTHHSSDNVQPGSAGSHMQSRLKLSPDPQGVAVAAVGGAFAASAAISAGTSRSASGPYSETHGPPDRVLTYPSGALHFLDQV